MINKIRLPKLGQTMEEGTIVSISVSENSKVAKGDVIFEIETDKATLEIESPQSGYIKKIVVNLGDTIPVNAPLAIIADTQDEHIPQSLIGSLMTVTNADKTEQIPSASQDAALTSPEYLAVAAAEITSPTIIKATPRAIKLANQTGINLSDIQLSPDQFQITEADVRKAASSQTNAKTAQAKDTNIPPISYKLGDTIPLTKMQKLIGQRMTSSKQNIPCFYLNTIADVTRLIEYRSNLNAQSPVKVSFNDLLIRAAALAITKFPIMAGQLENDLIKIPQNISIALAVAVGENLVAPVCKDADIKSITEIAQYNNDLIQRAKTASLTTDDLTGACLTLSNLGAFMIDSFIPIVVPGQCSILGIGRIKDELTMDNGEIITAKQMKLTLSVDHKIANGAYAAQFLDEIKKLLESPESL